MKPEPSASLRLAFVSWELPPENNGGIGAYTWHAARAFASRGHDVTVFCGRAAPAASLRREGVAVEWLDCADRRHFGDVAGTAFAMHHRNRPFDVVEVPDLYAEGGGISGRHPGLAVVVRAHTPSSLAHRVDLSAYPVAARLAQLGRLGAGEMLGFTPRGTTARRRKELFPGTVVTSGDPERRVAFNAGRVLAPSVALGQHLRRLWRMPADSITTLPYVHVPEPALLSLPPPKGPVSTVLFHGRVCHFKGMLTLARAIPQVLRRHPNITFRFAGRVYASPCVDWSPRAWRRAELCTSADTRELMQSLLGRHAARCEFLGYVSPADLPRLLGDADLCVQPSLFDNFPNACLEAMSAARPIVATRSGGMEDMLAPTDAGLLVPPGDARQLAHALLTLIENPELRADLARRARERVLAAYAPEVIVPRHEAYFRACLAARSVAA